MFGSEDWGLEWREAREEVSEVFLGSREERVEVLDSRMAAQYQQVHSE